MIKVREKIVMEKYSKGPNLMAMLANGGEINTSARTIDRAFSKLNNDPRIRVTKRGSFNTYQWEEDTPATPFP